MDQRHTGGDQHALKRHFALSDFSNGLQYHEEDGVEVRNTPARADRRPDEQRVHSMGEGR